MKKGHGAMANLALLLVGKGVDWSAQFSPLTAASQLLVAASLSGELDPELLVLCLLDDKLLWLFLQEIMLRLMAGWGFYVGLTNTFVTSSHSSWHIYTTNQLHVRHFEAELSFTTFETASHR